MRLQTTPIPIDKRPDTIWRVLWLLLTIALIVMFLTSAFSSLRAYAAEPATKIDINVANASPREVEETTRAAIQREYGSAWAAMTKSLAENFDAGIGASFVGAARDTLLSQLDQQKHNNLSTRIIDRGHKLDVVFYSPEGSAMQLRDTAQLEKQYLSGSSVVHSESITARYVVLMSVTEDRWKVRLLQELK
jgi:hypothetical protein